MTEDTLAKYIIGDAAKHLRDHGNFIGPFMPWHHSTGTYEWLVAEVLLRRTARTTAQRAFADLVDTFPSWQALASAAPGEIKEKIAWIGLGDQRSRQLKQMAEIVVDTDDEACFCHRGTLLRLPGVGNYIADSVLLHACGEKALPLDGNAQRILRRLIGLSATRGAVRLDPYRDSEITDAARCIISRHSSAELKSIHLGILHLTWEVCKTKPRCCQCPVREVCRSGSG